MESPIDATPQVGLVFLEARKLAKRTSIPYEEFLGAGTLAVQRALPGFDPARGLAMTTYLVPRIRGAMLDQLRNEEPGCRRLRRIQRQMRDARRVLRQVLFAEPTLAEVAELLQLPLARVESWRLRFLSADPFSLDDVCHAQSQGRTPPEPHADPEALEERHDQKRILWRAMRNLRPRERQVIVLYYWEDLNGAQIAELLGITESRISQLRKRALQRLREVLPPGMAA